MKRNIFILMLVIFTVTLMLVVGRHAAKNNTGAVQLLPGNLNGKAAPDFELKTVDGKTVRLSDYRGKAVLLNFWATWCPPCKIEMPWFVDLQKQYAGQGFQVIGVSVDDDAEKNADKIGKFAKEMNLNYIVLLGNDKVSDQYGGVEGLPTTFFIDRSGKIVGYIQGLESHSVIEDNIKKSLGTATAVADKQGQ